MLKVLPVRSFSVDFLLKSILKDNKNVKLKLVCTYTCQSSCVESELATHLSCPATPYHAVVEVPSK